MKVRTPKFQSVTVEIPVYSNGGKKRVKEIHISVAALVNHHQELFARYCRELNKPKAGFNQAFEVIACWYDPNRHSAWQGKAQKLLREAAFATFQFLESKKQRAKAS